MVTMGKPIVISHYCIFSFNTGHSVVVPAMYTLSLAKSEEMSEGGGK